MKKYQYFLVVLFLLSVPVFGQAIADPPSLPVYITNVPITVDGLLNEAAWSESVPHLMYKMNGTPSGQSYTPTSGIIVKEPYWDTSTTYVRFLRSDMDLYFSLQSNDKQVCRFDWEGDGLFMKIKDSGGAAWEYKIYVGALATFVFETNGPAGSGEGVGVPAAGTTIYDSSDTDNGYTAEMVIHLGSLGFTSVNTTMEVAMVIFDPDNYSSGVPPWGPNGNFAKQWWGSEWGDVFRILSLENTTVPVELTSFIANSSNGAVQLYWETATEINNKGFEVERSLDGEIFYAIGFVQGYGTTSEKKSYTFTDRLVNAGNTFYYRLKQVDFNGRYAYSDVVLVDKISTPDFSLLQNYPNPFNPSTEITFSLPVKSNVTVEVHNLIGEKVSTLADGSFSSGIHKVTFNASGFNSGIYFYTVKAVGENGEKFISGRKMTLVK